MFFLQLDGHEIKKGKKLKVNISIANQRLFVGNIPKSKTKDEIIEEFSKKTGKHCEIAQHSDKPMNWANAGKITF